MLNWLAERRRRKQDEALDAAGASVRRLFPEAIAFVAEQWTGMVDHMTHVAPDDWRSRSLETRILVFTDISPAIRDLFARFDTVRSRIADAVAAGICEDDARQQIQTGILAEALIATGEDRRAVTAILFPN